MNLRQIGALGITAAISVGIIGIIVAIYLNWPEQEVAVMVTEVEIKATERSVESRDVQIEQEQLIRGLIDEHIGTRHVIGNITTHLHTINLGHQAKLHDVTETNITKRYGIVIGGILAVGAVIGGIIFGTIIIKNRCNGTQYGQYGNENVRILRLNGNGDGIEMPPQRAIVNEDNDGADEILQEVVLG